MQIRLVGGTLCCRLNVRHPRGRRWRTTAERMGFSRVLFQVGRFVVSWRPLIGARRALRLLDRNRE